MVFEQITGLPQPSGGDVDSRCHGELVHRHTEKAGQPRDSSGMPSPFRKTFPAVGGGATHFCKGQSVHLNSLFPLIALPSLPGLVEAVPSHYYCCCYYPC